MRKTLFFNILVLTIQLRAQEDNAPVIGVSDVRVEVYGLKNARVVVDYQTITLNNAKILGIDDKTGTLEPGKDANIVVSTGDILDMSTNNVVYAFITGRNINLDNKHKQLYRRFEAKYENMK